jgi:hypothetical protein
MVAIKERGKTLYRRRFYVEQNIRSCLYQIAELEHIDEMEVQAADIRFKRGERKRMEEVTLEEASGASYEPFEIEIISRREEEEERGRRRGLGTSGYP